VLILSQHVEATYAQRLMQSNVGGSGYLLKDRDLDVLKLMTQGMSDRGIAEHSSSQARPSKRTSDTSSPNLISP
jgi:DNA-binding NarL/FixJ family response regulator